MSLLVIAFIVDVLIGYFLLSAPFLSTHKDVNVFFYVAQMDQILLDRLQNHSDLKTFLVFDGALEQHQCLKCFFPPSISIRHLG